MVDGIKPTQKYQNNLRWWIKDKLTFIPEIWVGWWVGAYDNVGAELKENGLFIAQPACCPKTLRICKSITI